MFFIFCICFAHQQLTKTELIFKFIFSIDMFPSSSMRLEIVIVQKFVSLFGNEFNNFTNIVHIFFLQWVVKIDSGPAHFESFKSSISSHLSSFTFRTFHPFQNFHWIFMIDLEKLMTIRSGARTARSALYSKKIR